MPSRPKRLRAQRRPDLSIADILRWADAHYEQTGRWPTCYSGRVAGTLHEKWPNLNAALQRGNSLPMR